MSIFRSSFPSYVQRQINVRQDLIKSNQRDSRFLMYTTGKNAWCRMTSFVNYDSPDGRLKGGDLSRQYILESGVLYPKPGHNSTNQTGAYTLRRGVSETFGSYSNQTFGSNPVNTHMGLRPMPGIVAIDIKTRLAYGSLREATIKFLAHSKQQLEDLEILFMRTGYSVLLEWGWSMYLDTYNAASKGSANTPSANTMNLNSVQLKNFNQPTINTYQANLDPHTLYQQIETLREKFSGNYDGLYGLIKNFEWTLLENGSYECTTVLISVGDVLDSLKINSTSLTIGSNKDQQIKNLQTKFESLFSPLLNSDIDYFINNVVGRNLYNQYQLNKKDPYDPLNADFEVYSLAFSKGPNNLGFTGQYGNLHYISFAAFIAAMNAQFNLFDPRQNGSVPLLNFELPYPGYGSFGNGLCLASEDSISIDPTICMIRNPYAQFVADPKRGFDIQQVSTLPFYPFHYQQNKSFGIIGNIYLCVENLIQQFKQAVANSNGYLGMHDFIKIILRQCSYALGSINDFGVFVQDSSIVIMDTHYMDPEATKNTKFILNLTGTDTIVRDFRVSSRIFENQSTLVAIGAGVRENIAAVQSSTYNLLNRGLTDRIIVQKLEHDAVTSFNQNNGTVDPDQRYRQELASMVLNLRTYVQAYMNNRDLSQIAGNKEAANSNLNSVLLKIDSDTNYKAVLPISLEFAMDGIGGIIVGNVFRINNDALPREYVSKNLGLIVKGISSRIENSDWVTIIEAYCCILEPQNVKGVNSPIDKDKIEKEITDQQQQNITPPPSAIDLLKQIYIYNTIVTIIIELLGDLNIPVINEVNDLIHNTNMFPPNFNKLDTSHTIENMIFRKHLEIFDIIDGQVESYPDFKNLNADFVNRVKIALTAVRTALIDGGNGEAVVPLLYLTNNQVNTVINLFIQTKV